MGPGRPSKEIPDKELVSLTIKLPPAVDGLLSELARSGFFGQDRREVVERLVVEHLRQMFEWEEIGKVRSRRRPDGK